ncbi:Os12g0228032, partial [Oryza sativa Japonica Group]
IFHRFLPCLICFSIFCVVSVSQATCLCDFFRLPLSRNELLIWVDFGCVGFLVVFGIGVVGIIRKKANLQSKGARCSGYLCIEGWRQRTNAVLRAAQIFSVL